MQAKRAKLFHLYFWDFCREVKNLEFIIVLKSIKIKNRTKKVVQENGVKLNF